MKFTVLIHQHLVGSVTIIAKSQKEAIDKAHVLFNVGGRELPDMDDHELLSFEAIPLIDALKDLDEVIE